MPPNAVLKARDAGGRTLSLHFVWRGDRYQHDLVFGEHSPAGPPAARSREGTATDDWPPSPAFQQLLVEQRGGQPVALLVGMSGTSHWSASIEPVAAAAAWEFDVAVRVRGAAPTLGSHYDVPGATQHLLRFTALEPARIRQSADGVGIETAGPTAAGPATVRWRYRIGWSD